MPAATARRSEPRNRAERRHPERWASVAQAAEYLGTHPDTVRRMVSRGELPAYRVGPRLLRIDLADVDRLARRVPTAGGAS